MMMIVDRMKIPKDPTTPQKYEYIVYIVQYVYLYSMEQKLLKHSGATLMHLVACFFIEMNTIVYVVTVTRTPATLSASF